jgi:hypothetical protein
VIIPIDPAAVRAQADHGGDTAARIAEALRRSQRSPSRLEGDDQPPEDGRCQSCRRGHYSLGNGVIANFPCTADRCSCFYCGKPPEAP